MKQASFVSVERDDQTPGTFENSRFEIAFLSRRDPDKAVSEDALFIVPMGEDAICVGVIDGMGGMAAGGKAARITAEVVAMEVAAHESPVKRRAALVEGFERAHARVAEECAGGGATAVAAIITTETVQMIHSGDAEGLQFSQRGHLRHRTPAHSPVGHGQQAGVLTELEALLHPERHLVSSGVGVEGMTIEVGPKTPLRARDVILLCSDGLTDNVFEAEIIEGMRRGPLPESLLRTADLATERMIDPFRIPTGHAIGKADDMTIVAIRRRSLPKR